MNRQTILPIFAIVISITAIAIQAYSNHLERQAVRVAFQSACESRMHAGGWIPVPGTSNTWYKR